MVFRVGVMLIIGIGWFRILVLNFMFGNVFILVGGGGGDWSLARFCYLGR